MKLGVHGDRLRLVVVSGVVPKVSLITFNSEHPANDQNTVYTRFWTGCVGTQM